MAGVRPCPRSTKRGRTFQDQDGKQGQTYCNYSAFYFQNQENDSSAICNSTYIPFTVVFFFFFLKKTVFLFKTKSQSVAEKQCELLQYFSRLSSTTPYRFISATIVKCQLPQIFQFRILSVSAQPMPSAGTTLSY